MPVAAPLHAAPMIRSPHQLIGSSPAMLPRPPVVADNPSIAPVHPTALQPASGADLGDDSPLEIAHVLGLNGSRSRCTVCHPTASPPTVVYGVGCLVAVRPIDDPHQQQLLRGHDATVSAVDVTASGRLIVSGQEASRTGKEGLGYVVVWDYASLTAVYRLRGHGKGVLCVCFSCDDRWVASSGGDGRLLIWDMQNGDCAGGVKDVGEGETCATIAWGEVTDAGTRNQAYELTAAYNTGVRGLRWSFEVRTMQYALQQRRFQVPGAGGKLGGFVRNYLCSALLPSGDLLCGTASGDIVVYGTRQALYRTSFTVSSAGALSVCASANCHTPGGCVVFVGAGDGRLRKMVGTDREWVLQQEVQLKGGITSLTCGADGVELIAATSAGLMYRVLVADMACTVAGESHTAALVDAAVPRDRSDRFASCGEDGVVRLWDLSDYTTVSRFESRPHTPTSLCFASSPASLLLTGWSDGALRGVDCRSEHATAEWVLHTAHRGAVTCCAAADTYYLTAGADGMVRIWTRSNRECAGNLQDHKRPVAAVLIDTTTPRIIHSISADRCLHSYDLAQEDGQLNSRQPRRIATKNDATGSGFTSMCQRLDHEREIVATTAEGRILFYDIDYDRPVHVIVDRARARANCVALNPQGTHLCVAQQDGLIVIYQLVRDQAAGATAVAQGRCHSASAVRAIWSPDGKQIISLGGDGEICVWNFFL
eukprot:TRINITY_DN4655_c0_g3_i1.p1 TRINITY_DN4655_c0_g3~~TRINITY_DN4655_c0_g3_i1.p1  ORF type:complete len:730 (+),score=150.92 TRINITY_DN4655_c0_g3_i1:66-2192(+)